MSKHEASSLSQQPVAESVAIDEDLVLPTTEELVARVAALEIEVSQQRDYALRAVAESENTRKRLEREKDENSKFVIASFARDLLSVADNLRRALESADSKPSTDGAISPLLAGIEATERELLAVFERRNIKRLTPQGEVFDPNFHQAMFEVPDSGHAAGTVIQVLQPGYTLHERLLRPALVSVAKDTANNSEESFSG